MTASKMTQYMKSGIKDWASRRKTMIMRALSDSFRVSVYGGLLAGALTASAETLAWYKFSEQSDGVQATCVADTVLDSSGNGKAGTVVSVKDKEEGSDATLAPTYRSAYACRLYDPVSGNGGRAAQRLTSPPLARARPRRARPSRSRISSGRLRRSSAASRSRRWSARLA